MPCECAAGTTARCQWSRQSSELQRPTFGRCPVRFLGGALFVLGLWWMHATLLQGRGPGSIPGRDTYWFGCRTLEPAVRQPPGAPPRSAGLRLLSAGSIPAGVSRVSQDASGRQAAISSPRLSGKHSGRQFKRHSWVTSLRLGQPAIELVGECLPVSRAKVRRSAHDMAFPA